MAYSLVSNTAASGTDSSVTTTAINTTGASLLVLGIAVDGAATPTISDSKGNTWTALTAQSLTVNTTLLRDEPHSGNGSYVQQYGSI